MSRFCRNNNKTFKFNISSKSINKNLNSDLLNQLNNILELHTELCNIQHNNNIKLLKDIEQQNKNVDMCNNIMDKVSLALEEFNKI